ncbi:MAG: hypothetical protein M3R38_04380 [Actinomycetota bacterium]|nr:hypothetical protein [Actinomycetota bacterium]
MPAAAERRSRRRATVYGDEAEVAEDTAFLFFRAQGLPVDARLYVTSAAFGGEHAWERGMPLGCGPARGRAPAGRGRGPGR